MLEQDPAGLDPRAKLSLVDVGERDAGYGWRAHASALYQRRLTHTMENVITVPGGFCSGGRAALWVILSSPRAPSSAAALSGKAFAATNRLLLEERFWQVSDGHGNLRRVNGVKSKCRYMQHQLAVIAANHLLAVATAVVAHRPLGLGFQMGIKLGFEYQLRQRLLQLSQQPVGLLNGGRFFSS